MKNRLAKDMAGNRHGGLMCALICLFSAVVSIIPFAILSGGFFHVWSDFSWQQVPFGMALHRSLESLNPGGWTWNYGLGMSTIQAFTFYAFGTPFYLLSLPFPASWYPYLVAWIYVIKYTVAGLTAYFYIRRFTEKDISAVAGALMYAFSGFQATNLMFYHFHDITALFPLILIGMERIMADPSDRKPLVFAVFINALANYYFFVVEAVFTILYFVFRSVSKEKGIRCFLRDAANCFLCSAWGVAMAAIVFLPSVIYVLHSPRANSSFHLSDLIGDMKWTLFVLRGLLLPADKAVSQACIILNNWQSAAAYLPFAGMALCLAYMKKERNWLTGMICALLVVSFSPLLSSGFILFTENTLRWWFALVLMMALASAKVIDHSESYNVGWMAVGYALAVLAFCLIIYFVPYNETTPTLVYAPKRLAVFAGLAVLGVGLILWLLKTNKLCSGRMLLLASVCAVLTTGTTLYLYWSSVGDGTSREMIELGTKLETIEDQYRYDLTNNQLMLTGNGSGMTVFSSTISQGEREFDSLFGYYSHTHSMNKNLIRGLPELFGAKFTVTMDSDGQNQVIEIGNHEENWFVTEKPACPIGFAVDHYIVRERLMDIENEKKGVVLLHAAVIRPEDEGMISGICTAIDPETIDFEEDVSAVAVKISNENAVCDFRRDSRGFRCRSDFSKQKLVYFSIPDEGGWTATIDGQKQDIIPSAGMMLLVVPEGKHDIEFTYVTPGYKAGIVISATAWLLFIVWLAAGRLFGTTGLRGRSRRH